jgi:RNA polymerase sigma-70 factor (ECF subfamily)
MKSDQSPNSAAQPPGSEPCSREKKRGVLNAFIDNQIPLRRFISRYMFSMHDIDDVSQEVFLRAYNAEKKGPVHQPKAFLFRIAKNLMLTEFSKKSRKLTDYIADFEYTEVLASDETLETSLMAQQKLGIYCEAVATLPEKCRRVVLMKKVYGLSHKEIAVKMGIQVSTVEKHLTKGVRQCHAIMAERYSSVNEVNINKAEVARTLPPDIHKSAKEEGVS